MHSLVNEAISKVTLGAVCLNRIEKIFYEFIMSKNVALPRVRGIKKRARGSNVNIFF